MPGDDQRRHQENAEHVAQPPGEKAGLHLVAGDDGVPVEAEGADGGGHRRTDGCIQRELQGLANGIHRAARIGLAQQHGGDHGFQQLRGSAGQAGGEWLFKIPAGQDFADHHEGPPAQPLLPQHRDGQAGGRPERADATILELQEQAGAGRRVVKHDQAQQVKQVFRPFCGFHRAPFRLLEIQD